MKPIEIGVLGVQGDIEEHESALRLAFQEEKVEGHVTRPKSSPEAENISGLVIPGGESTTIGRLAANEAILETLRDRIAKGLPVFGTCAGLIMLADKAYDKVLGETHQPLLGGLDVVVERNHFGRQQDSFEADLSIPELGEKTFRGVFIRSPIVKQVGSKVETLSKLGEKIVAVKQGNIIGTCFHPELSGDTRLHKHFIRIVGQNPLLG